MTGGPHQGQVYSALYTPYITYTDYCMIMHQIKYDGNAWITFECDSFKEFYYSWSGWLYLLFWQYCPKDVDFFNETDNEAFKIWFHAEVCEAAQHEAWFVFSLSFKLPEDAQRLIYADRITHITSEISAFDLLTQDPEGKSSKEHTHSSTHNTLRLSDSLAPKFPNE
jgi:hypothetical protein